MCDLQQEVGSCVIAIVPMIETKTISPYKNLLNLKTLTLVMIWRVESKYFFRGNSSLG